MEKSLNRYVIFNFLVLLVCCNPYPNYIQIDRTMDINREIRNCKIERGAIVLNEKYILPAFCPLILNERDNANIYKDYASYFKEDVSQPIPIFGDLKIPYKIYKEKRSEFIFVVKNEDTLMFKVVKF